MKSAAVLYVTDLHRMRIFYQAGFGMEIVEEADDYSVLESDALSLSLVVVPARIADRIVLSDPPARREGAAIKLAFSVDSIDDLRPTISKLGGLVDPPGTQWEFRGNVHCDGVDPEGNVIQMVEPISPQPQP